MTIIDCEQGSREWHEARLGVPTASKFSRLLTPRGLKPSSQQRDYMGRLLAEWVTGEPMDGDLEGSPWVERGRLLEPQARQHYGIVQDVAPQRIGFCRRDLPLQMTASGNTFDLLMEPVGASPDALVGEGLLELKCPAPHTHILWLATGELPAEHRMQVQGQLWVTGRAWCDFLSFHPDLPPVLVRVEPDPDVQRALDEVLPEFCAALSAGRQRLVDMGVRSWRDREEEHAAVMAEHDRAAAMVHMLERGGE